MSRTLASTAVPAGCVSYMNVSAIGLKPDVLFVYDINLPETFVPTPLDGEVCWEGTGMPTPLDGEMCWEGQRGGGGVTVAVCGK